MYEATTPTQLLPFIRGPKRKRQRATTSIVGRPPFKKARTGQLTVQKGNNKNVATLYTYPFPAKIKTKLKVLQNIGLISALTSSSALVYRPSSYFDVDPAVGGASFAGYTFYASQYGRYRVTAFKYKASFVNLESTSVLVSCHAIPDDGTPASGTATDFTEYAVENDWAHYAVCPPTTSTPEKVLTGYVDCQKLWGTPETKTDAAWAGSTGGNPSANSWLRIAAHMANNNNLTVGVQCILEIESYGYWDMKNTDVGS